MRQAHGTSRAAGSHSDFRALAAISALPSGHGAADRSAKRYSRAGLPHLERRLAGLRRPSQLEYLEHELLHGAFLVHSLLEIVGRSGEVGQKRNRLFVKHPKLRRIHERALAATWDLYQAVGALTADVRKGD